MLIIKLAFRNMVGGGFRTWLNVFILSVVMVTIVGFHGLYIGWQRDAQTETIQWHIASGQYWQSDYDPYDQFSYEKSRAVLPQLKDIEMVSFLVSQGTLYPQGRSKNITLKGVQTEQNLLELPSAKLAYEKGKYKMMLGIRTARKLGLEQGDRVMLRWRDNRGSFDAAQFEIVHVFKSSIASLDQGIVWLGLNQMQEMLKTKGMATYFTVNQYAGFLGDEWVYKSPYELLEEFRAVYSTELTGGIFMYILLLILAMIAVFDTQVLALFKRRREVGMMMAQGMRPRQIIRIFILEGLLSGVIAAALAAIWGTPLLIKFQQHGLKLPDLMNDYAMEGIYEAMYPQYTILQVLMTFVIIMCILAVVSYFPVRKISKLKPVDALRGRMSK